MHIYQNTCIYLNGIEWHSKGTFVIPLNAYPCNAKYVFHIDWLMQRTGVTSFLHLALSIDITFKFKDFSRLRAHIRFS